MTLWFVGTPAGDLLVAAVDEKQVAAIVKEQGFYYSYNIIPVQTDLTKTSAKFDKPGIIAKLEWYYEKP